MRAIALAFALAIGACAIVYNDVTAQKNPQFASSRYRKIIVIGQFSDLRLQQTAERGMARKCPPQVQCIPSGDVFFPGKDYTPEERLRVLQEQMFDAVLFITQQSSGFSQVYIPRTSSTYATGQMTGNQFSGSASTTESGGFYMNRPHAQYQALLVDVATGEPAWMASIGASGNVAARTNDLVGSLPSEIATQLRRDGLFMEVRK